MLYFASVASAPNHVANPRRYLVAEDEKQSTFTGAQHRNAVYIIPHAVSGVFGLGEDRPVPLDPAVLRRAGGRGRRRGGGAEEGGDAGSDNASADSFFNAGDGDGEELPAGFMFNWGAYREAFGDTPLEDAITAMFTEYAALYARIAGWATSSAPAPMTMDVAEALAKDAADFVIGFVKPLLGEVHTSKMHKLLRHLLDAIRLHGNLRNGNTSSNEAGHKVDKVYYNRTNKVIKTFTQQIVRQSQGSQAVVARNAVFDAAASRSGRRVRSEVARPFRGVPRLSVGTLCMRPGLARLSELLGQPAATKMLVVGQVELAAKLECGFPIKQMLRGSPSYRTGQAWFDAVQYEVPELGADSEREAVRLCYGETRAILRYSEEDVVVLCKFLEVPAVPGCPLTERLCTRISWDIDDNGVWGLEVVPLSRVRRVVHVAPDFDDLGRRRGMRACPPTYVGNVKDLREMRFFVNDMYPWK